MLTSITDYGQQHMHMRCGPKLVCVTGHSLLLVHEYATCYQLCCIWWIISTL